MPAAAFKYLVLSGELPGEAFWCVATTYDDLVRRVKELWGESYNPVFKYKMQASPEGCAEELEYHNASNAFSFRDDRAPKPGAQRHQSLPPSPDSNPGERGEEDAVSPEGDVPQHKKASPCVTGLCYVMIDDACDFSIWLDGDPAVLAAAEDTTKGPKPRYTPLTSKLYAFRKTTVEKPDVLSHNIDASQQSYLPFYHTVTNKDGIFRFRSSPAVKHSEDDVVKVPLNSLLPPLLLTRLGITAVLRHSNASEVILWSSKSPLAGGVGWWGQLMLKATSAWGVHSPVMRYVDLTMGRQEMSITDVLTFRMWSEGVGLDRQELVVLELAPPSSLCYDAFLKDRIIKHRAAHPPPPRIADVSLDQLVEKMRLLEQEDRDARVSRPLPVSIAGDEPQVAESLQHHINGIPLHRLGLAPPAASRNLTARIVEEEAEDKPSTAPPLVEDDTTQRHLTGRAIPLEEVNWEDEGLVSQLRKQHKKTSALEELIMVEKCLRLHSEMRGESDTNIFEGIIPELSTTPNGGRHHNHSNRPHLSSRSLEKVGTPPAATDLGSSSSSSVLKVEGSICLPGTTSIIIVPSGEFTPPREEGGKRSPGIRAALRQSLDASRPRSTSNSIENNSYAVSAPPPRHVNRANGVAEGIHAGDYGPSFTTPAVLTLTEQQKEAAAHHANLRQHFRFKDDVMADYLQERSTPY